MDLTLVGMPLLWFAHGEPQVGDLDIKKILETFPFLIPLSSTMMQDLALLTIIEMDEELCSSTRSTRSFGSPKTTVCTDRMTQIQQAFQTASTHQSSLQEMFEELVLELEHTKFQLRDTQAKRDSLHTTVQSLESKLSQCTADNVLLAAKTAECESLKSENRTWEFIYRASIAKLKREGAGRRAGCPPEQLRERTLLNHMEKMALVEQNKALRGEIVELTGKGSRHGKKNSGETITKVKKKVAELRESVEILKGKKVEK